MAVTAKPDWHRNDGESMVSVLVAVAILAVATSFFASAFAQVTRSDRDGKMRASFRDVEPGFKLYLLRQIRAYSRETGCDQDRFDGYFTSKPIGHWAMPRFVTAAIPISGDAPAVSKEAASRCAEPLVAGAAEGDFHFCIALERLRDNEPPSSFLAAERPFAEIRIRLEDYSTGAPLRCRGVWSTANAGITATYGIHWARLRVGQSRGFYNYMGWFYAAN